MSKEHFSIYLVLWFLSLEVCSFPYINLIQSWVTFALIEITKYLKNLESE